MYKKLERGEAEEYYSEYYPKILRYWQKTGHEPRPLILRKLRIKNKKVLDVGCGNALMLEGLVKNNEVYGVDISKELVKEANKRGVLAKYCNVDESPLPYPGKEFDCIILFETLEHVWKQKELLDECYRVLRPKGKIYITLPNEDYPCREEIIQKSLQKAIKNTFKKNTEKAERMPDVKIVPLTGLNKMLNRAGFTVRNMHGWSWDFEDLSSKERSGMWNNYKKSPDLLIIASKDK